MEKRVLKINGENVEIVIDDNNDAMDIEAEPTLDLTEVVEEINGQKED